MTSPLRRIAGLFRPYRWLMAGLVMLVVGQGLTGVVAPFLLRAIIDRGLPARDAVLITWLALGMVASSVASGLLGVYASQLSNVVGQRVMHHLRVARGSHDDLVGRSGRHAALLRPREAVAAPADAASSMS